mmetsp:Transcript_10360/g.31217  ORF Transcript_10360/g.31217 Transcript_10360/m.31217 type:complete len:427 (+) Transcript_10360:685-1965(+)
MAALNGRTVETKLLLPNAKVGVVIGKGGAVINHIRETSKASLDVAEPTGSAQGGGGPGQQAGGGPVNAQQPPERVVTFAGEFAAVYTAFQMVLQHLASSQQQLGTLEEAQPVLEAVVLVPRNKTGGLIGRSGSSINRVRSDSGATVKVGAPEDMVPSEPDVRKCVVSGTIDQVMQAFALIVHKLEDTPAGAARAPDPNIVGGGQPMGAGGPPGGMGAGGPGGYGPGVGHPGHHPGGHPGGHPPGGGMPGPPHPGHHHPGGGGGGGGGHMSQQPLAPGTMPVQFQVPNESMGAVIGRAGATINQIRQMSGAKVDIAQSVPGMAMRLVTVTGTPEQIQMAQYLIQVKMGGGALPTSSYGLVSTMASAAAQGGHDYAAIAQQQHLQQQQLDNYGQPYNQQEYQQLQQMHQMQQGPGPGYPGMGGYPGAF